MKYTFLLLLLFLNCAEDTTPPTPAPSPSPLIRAVDLSFLPEIEAEGTVFFDELGVPKDVLTIFKAAGGNTVRLRLWHTATHANLTEVSTFAKRLKAQGLKVWVTVHYSDTWADPSQQTMPDAWKNLTLSALKDSVFAYTQTVVNTIEPDYIQVGNEINNGFLWNLGENGQNFYDLLAKGCEAVRLAKPDCQIILHYAGTKYAEAFFSEIDAHLLDYDIIGISYYPMWHEKNLTTFTNDLKTLHLAKGKPVVIAETSYPFTLGWNDWTNNVIGLQEQILPDFPASEQGQYDFLRTIRDISAANGNIGFCYWGTEWVAFKGNNATDGSAWENQALFDFNGKVLKAMKVFE